MRILVVSSFVPYPLFAGGYIRLYNLIKQLSQKNDVTLICEKRSKQNITPIDMKELEKICKKVIVVPARRQWSLQNILNTAKSPYPFLLVGHTLPEMKKRIVEELSQKQYDLIHIETFYIMQNLPKTFLPVVLAEHNIEYEVYEKFAKTAPLLLRPLLYIDIAKMKYFERKFWQKATKLVAVSEEEKKRMTPNTTIVANGVDLESFPYKKSVNSKEKTILFMGDFKWIQNREAAKWIVKEIWPEIVKSEKLKGQKIKLWVVGKNIPMDLKALRTNDVIFDEHAPDKTSEIYRKSDILLAPITVGGGTSYKILEAMASGVPVVTTPLGVVGLGAREREAMVGETTDELADQTINLITNRKLYDRLRSGARSFIEKKYSWKEIAKVLEKVYKEAVEETKG